MDFNMNFKVFIVFLTLFKLNSGDLTKVFIEQGAVEGKISSDGIYIEFNGIPYATANASNRFQAPLPPPTWDGVFQATNYSIICPQPIDNTVAGQEDCLRINVYVPKNSKRPLPVMFYIHEGGFAIGDGGKLLLGPGFLMRRDIILVTFNYRLGALGFLCLGIKEAPGNAGLKDQLAALRWVKRNIAAFGGDPNEITIFGESSGAASVAYMLTNNKADGLYKAAILQSGASIASWAFSPYPVRTASLLAKSLGFDTNDPKELYRIFSEASYEDLVQKTGRNDMVLVDQYYYNFPCIEKHFPGVEQFLSDTPYNILKRKSLDIPIIYGSNSNEALITINQYNDDDMKLYSDAFFMPNDLGFPSEEEKETAKNRLKNLYLGEDQEFNMNNKRQFTKYLSHIYYNMPNLLEFDLIKRNTKKPIYYYLFNYSGERNAIKMLLNHTDEPGASHGDDLFYLFNGTFWTNPGTKKDQTMVEWMTRMWSNFAKFGDPTPDFDKKLPVKWTPSNPACIANSYLYIEDEMKMGPVPFREEYEAWRDVYEKYRRLSV